MASSSMHGEIDTVPSLQVYIVAVGKTRPEQEYRDFDRLIRSGVAWASIAAGTFLIVKKTEEPLSKILAAFQKVVPLSDRLCIAAVSDWTLLPTSSLQSGEPEALPE